MTLQWIGKVSLKSAFSELEFILCHLLVIGLEATQSCPTLCDHIDCSLLSSSAHGIFQARILEWVAILSSRGCSWPWNIEQLSPDLLHCRQILYHLSHHRRSYLWGKKRFTAENIKSTTINLPIAQGTPLNTL